MAKAGAKKKAANGYKLAEIIPAGEILEDIRQNKWRLGVAVGQGGFGRIYSAQDASSSGSSYPFVIKIEPHANGPLFVEMQFYIRNAKPEDVNAFKKEKKLKSFGMPLYLGSGSHEYKGEKYRFVVTEHFGTDIWKVFLENNEIFPVSTVFKLAVQILDVLEYIHSRGYVHADIKGANILMGKTKETKNKQVYLVDFGLATKYSSDKEYKPDPKKAHDGTIEYLSRDAHKGVQTRRGDLEILAYNIIQWLGCKLPWMSVLKNPKDVQESKEKYMKEIPKFIQLCFGKRSPPGPIVDYLNYITNLEFNIEPDYQYIRKIFISGIKSGDSLDKTFQFTTTKQTPVKRKSETKAAPSPRKKTAKTKHAKQPQQSEDEKENDVDSENEKLAEESTETVSPRQGRARNRINYKEDSDEESRNSKKRLFKKSKAHVSKDLHVTGDNLEGYNDAMKEVVHKKKQKNTRKKKKEEPQDNTDDNDDDMDGYTDAMKEIATKKKAIRKNINEEDSDDNDEDDDMEGHTNEIKEVAVKQKPTSRKKKEEPKDIADDDMDGYNDEMKEIAVKKKAIKKKKHEELKDSADDDDMDGYTNEIKEMAVKQKTIRKKKNAEPKESADDDDDIDDYSNEIAVKQKTTRKKRKEEPKDIAADDDDDMDGYTDEMKELAVKKKNSKKAKPTKLVTSSKTSRKHKVEVPSDDDDVSDKD